MKRPGPSNAKTPRPARWAVALGLVFAAGAVLAITVLARERAERRLAAEASARPGRPPPPMAPAEAAPDEADDEEPDPALEQLLASTEREDAPLRALDAAAHALLVREAFDEAEPLVRRALALAPGDAEAAIHRAVLRGVGGDIAGARRDLDRLAQGPAGWEASLFAAGFALRERDDAAALAALRRFRALAPPEEVTPALAAQIAELEARLRNPAFDKHLQNKK